MRVFVVPREFAERSGTQLIHTKIKKLFSKVSSIRKLACGDAAAKSKIQKSINDNYKNIISAGVAETRRKKAKA